MNTVEWIERPKHLLMNWCSIIAFMLSSNDWSRLWLPSFASKKLGEDMEEKS